jgi:hypothetical protein
VLVTARLDRITRRARTLSQLLEDGISIRAAGMPAAPSDCRAVDLPALHLQPAFALRLAAARPIPWLGGSASLVGLQRDGPHS